MLTKKSVCRVGIVGCGNIAKVHLSAYDSLTTAKVIAVSDIDEKKAEETANKFRIGSWYRDYNEMFKRKDIDMVDICLPVFLHCDAVLNAANLGKHILCEKPISINLEEADKMVNATKEAGIKFMVAFMYRFEPLLEKVKQYIEKGIIGKPILIWVNNIWKPNFIKESWLSNREKSGGMLVEHAIHFIDLFRWWSGEEAVSVSAFINKVDREIKVEDNICVSIKFKNETIATLNQSWSSYLPWNEIGIVGINGSAELLGSLPLMHSKYDTLKIRSKNCKTKEIRNLEPLIRYSKEISHFIECILENKNPEVSGTDARKALEIALAAYKSAEENRIVNIPI